MVSKKQQRQHLKAYIQGLIQKATPLELELVWIPKIYQFQLAEEKQYKDTLEQNGVGLTKADAFIISKFASRIEKGGHLSPEEAQDLKARLPKYWKQYAAQMTKIPCIDAPKALEA